MGWGIYIVAGAFQVWKKQQMRNAWRADMRFHPGFQGVLSMLGIANSTGLE